MPLGGCTGHASEKSAFSRVWTETSAPQRQAGAPPGYRRRVTRTALFDSPSADVIAPALVARARARFGRLDDAALADLVADTVFLERKRLEHDEDDPTYVARVDRAARAMRALDRGELEGALLALVDGYAREIHNPFSPRAYHLATRVLPGALTRLLSASTGADLLRPSRPEDRIHISGPLDTLRRFADRHVLILAPTHVSNLDSPLIGYALYAAGLPPFAYGAGLNLFSNPVMAFFMRRLGAYTVDRRKRARLYKYTLKDYSVEILRRGSHSLFFPGGTRSRSGRLERNLKKGLLGTGLAAWQEELAAGRGDREVFIVPCTLSMGIVLEAESLIADALAEEGKQRYIIMDDAFSEPRTVAAFVRRLLQLDAPVELVFGRPLDIAGNPVDDEGVSRDPHGRAIDRRAYVCDREGRVEVDEQRDHVYTERVACKLCEAYLADFVIQSTHLAAWAAWEALRATWPALDTWRLVRLPAEQRAVTRAEVEGRIAAALPQLAPWRRVGPDSPGGILDEALHLFANFHRQRALGADGDRVRLDGELCLYYRNRLDGHGLRS